jgi:hypothetical protein
VRTPQDLLDYVDQIIEIGVDKTEIGSQFALIELQPALAKQTSVENAEGCEGTDGNRI